MHIAEAHEVQLIQASYFNVVHYQEIEKEPARKGYVILM